MKARTEEQKRVMSLFSKMQSKWHFTMPKRAYKNLNEGVIGQTLIENRKAFRCDCLYCVSQKIEDYQVFRFYWIYKYNYKRKVANPKKDYEDEIYSIFYNVKNKKITLVARRYDGLSSWTACRPVFSLYSNFEVRPTYCKAPAYNTPYYRLDTYDTYFVSRHEDFPSDEITNKMFADCEAPLDVLEKMNIMQSSQYETMSKRGEVAICEYLLKYGEFNKPTWKSFLCSLRHGRKFGDICKVSDFIDLLKILRELKLDTHSPKYLAILEDSEEHKQLLTRLRNKRKRDAEIAQRKRDERRLLEMQKEKENYLRKIEQFRTLSIKVNDNITARILPNVEEFLNEGDAMHHCVYSCKYYSSEKSVVLSARDSEGNRVETIEVDVAKGKVLQSRGKYNKPTEWHDEIVKVVNLMFLTELHNAKRRYKLGKE